MKTFSLRKEDVKREWHLLDARGQVLGRLAVQAAELLIGKHKPNFTPHIDNGDYVVVINAADVRVTGRKLKQKMYYRHTGYLGNLKELTLAQMLAKDPRKVIWLAVRGMLPKNKLRQQRLGRLKVFNDDQHPYADKLKKNGQ